ncbi:TA system VapC family ribonuclease toxin [Luteolibacter soli]|uniref:Ribonuclease VapC n=1 Tax=Luteolibacter soli TaxID=3135280 RepID=A0ABU9B0Y4_9BACT
MRALLDVNVLIALLDGSHAFHAKAHGWWAAQSANGWASCPLTENAVVRIMCHPSYSAARRFTAGEIIAALSAFASGTNHCFWHDDLSFRDSSLFDPTRIHGPKQLTDLYLLALAVANGGCLATFDQAIPLSVVKGAGPAHLIVL